MCTVSFISVIGSVIITSNRDEHIQRGTAAAPSFGSFNNNRIIFPKDAKAGGTWFAASERGVVAVLLNGAFVKHIAKPPYRKSRGLVLLDIVSADNSLLFFNKMDLENIEPFTVIIYQPGELYELRWDGECKYENLLNSSGNYIWSSATLYSDEAIGQKQELFDKFIAGGIPTSAAIYKFHTNAQEPADKQDKENGFIINRSTGMRTFSVTQAVILRDKINFLHSDLLQHQIFEETMPISGLLVNQ